MSILFDTNIIVNIIRARNRTAIINFLNPNSENIYVSVVSEAEAKSISIRNHWGTSRKKLLDNFLDQVTLVEVTQLFVSAYTEIDTYSQRVNPGFDNYPFQTPRNMGKNDLWIASAASLFGLNLITTDADFDHLHNVFFEVIKIRPEDLISFNK
jgi:tRNA(fMet)-specific endonuclease VapC